METLLLLSSLALLSCLLRCPRSICVSREGTGLRVGKGEIMRSTPPGPQVAWQSSGEHEVSSPSQATRV